MSFLFLMMNLYAKKKEKPQAPFCVVCVLTAGLPFCSLSLFFYCPFAGLTIFFLITITILIKNRFNNMTISYAYSNIQHRYIYQNHRQISLVSYLVSLFLCCCCCLLVFRGKGEWGLLFFTVVVILMGALLKRGWMTDRHKCTTPQREKKNIMWSVFWYT